MTAYRQLPAVNTELKTATPRLEAAPAGRLADGCCDSWPSNLGNKQTMKIGI
jgi:hypothetical protein